MIFRTLRHHLANVRRMYTSIFLSVFERIMNGLLHAFTHEFHCTVLLVPVKSLTLLLLLYTC